MTVMASKIRMYVWLCCPPPAHEMKRLKNGKLRPLSKMADTAAGSDIRLSLPDGKAERFVQSDKNRGNKQLRK